MAHGFRPLRDIFSDQGPWLLQVLYLVTRCLAALWSGSGSPSWSPR